MCSVSHWSTLREEINACMFEESNKLIMKATLTGAITLDCWITCIGRLTKVILIYFYIFINIFDFVIFFFKGVKLKFIIILVNSNESDCGLLG